MPGLNRPDLPALIAAALGRPLPAAAHIAVAVSGGPDSLALLGLAASALPGRITAITVDHALRAGSAAEAAGVAQQCAARGIPHAMLRRDGPVPAANVQAVARAARYGLMADWCRTNGAALLLTAHHADDQAETLVMRLNRASGSAGLAGIRRCRDLGGVMLVRPLLGLRKAALAAIAAADGWQAVDDPANHDPRHDRTGARALLAANPGLDVAAIADAAAHLADEAAALDWAADLAWRGRVHTAGATISIDAGGLPAALVQRLLARAIAGLGGTPRGGAVARLAARLAAGQAGTLAGVQARPGTVWRLSPAPPRQRREKMS